MPKPINFSKVKKRDFKIPEWSLKSDKPISENKLKHVIGTQRQLIYSKNAKKNVSENKLLVKSFLELFNRSISDERRELSNNTLSKTIMSKTGKPITVTLKELRTVSKNSYHTDNFFLFSIGSKKKSKKYFVKYNGSFIGIKQGFNGINEMIALDVIKSAGFNVVPAHLSYVDYKESKSFIFYEFQNKLVDAEVAYQKNLIDFNQVKSIRSRLELASKKINKHLASYNKLKVNSNSIIRDVVPNEVKSFEALPVFIDLKTKKLFIYDPWLYERISKKS